MPSSKLSFKDEFLKGIVKENPVLVTLLGMCPILAVTTMAYNGLGMGLATAFVLLCSNIAISVLSRVIPNIVRLPCYIVIIASFVTITEFLIKGYIPPLYESLGIFLPLITANCVILGRAEMFASKHKVFRSAVDALGMGLGYTLALFLVGSIREILGTGTWLAGTPLMIDLNFKNPMSLFIMPAGGLFVLGVVIAVINKITHKKPPQEIGCQNCPRASVCPTFNKDLPINEEELTISIFPESSD